MSFMDKFERKYGRAKLPNLMMVLMAGYALGFLVTYVYPAASYYMMFMPELIFQGEVWRLITFLFYPSDSGLFMAMITCFIYFSISKALEQIIGRFRLNFFLIFGILFQIAFGFIYYFMFEASGYGVYVMALSPYYLYSMLFVLFAMIYPNAQFLFMFFIPIRGKFMVFITLGMCLIDVVRAFVLAGPAYAWIIIFMVVAAVVALMLFILLCGYRVGGSVPNNVTRMHRTRRAAEFEKATKVPFRHKCTICGRTDVTNPELTFRYCSKCEGNYEYCNEHLYTHVHKTTGSQGNNQ